MDTRLPHSPGRDDFASYVRFLDNRKEFDRYVALLDKKIIEFMDAVALYGKAKDIGRLHASAAAMQQQAQDAFTEREEKLATDEAAFKRMAADKETQLAATETTMQDRHNTKATALRDREVSLQDREAAIGAREAEATRKTAAAERAKEAAKDAKRAAEQTVRNMQAVMPAT